MNFTEYQELASRTMGNDDTMVEAALGLAGESGEVVDLIKKIRFQDQDISNERVAEEIGDVIWYCAALAGRIGYDLSKVAEMNLAKLHRRYPDGFVKGGGVRG